MKKVCLTGLMMFMICLQQIMAQDVAAKIKKQVDALLKEPQMKHGILGLYIIESNGSKVFGHNEQMGLVPASTQKIFTSIAAWETLGSDFTYTTTLAYEGNISNGILKGNLLIIPSGDPTLGSDNYSSTDEKLLYREWMNALAEKNIQSIDGSLKIITRDFSAMKYPSGWIWEDIGNYYGASHGALNWKENKFDLYFNTGIKTDDPVTLSKISPWYIKDFSINASELLTAAKGSGDNAFAFLQPADSQEIFVQGTLPAGEKNYSISISHPDPAQYLSASLRSQNKIFQIPVKSETTTAAMEILHIHHSPTLDSINHFFLKKSINLYGEALIKTLGAKKYRTHSTDNGVKFLQEFWQSKGVESSALQVVDGSGLSPLNRVTPESLVSALKFARSKPYYSSLNNAFPLINGIRMKSGTISGAKAYAGFVKSASGKEYIFSIMVNNYDGSSGTIVRRMFAILDQLK